MAVAEEAVVWFVGEGLHDGRLDLPADAAFQADGSARADPGMRVDPGPTADPDRAVETDEGSDLGAGLDDDRAFAHDDLLRDLGASGGKEPGPDFSDKPRINPHRERPGDGPFVGTDDLVGERQHLDLGIGLRKRERLDRFGRDSGVGQHGIDDGLIGATAIGGRVQEGRGDRGPGADDRSATGLDQTAERDEIVAAGHGAGVDQQHDRAVRGNGWAGRRERGRTAPQGDAAAGDGCKVAGQVGPQRPVHGAEVAE